jgi:hypothetical protein
MATALEIVNKFSQTQDKSLLADNFKFIGPVDQTEGIEAFMELNASFFPMVADMRMLQQFENGDNVCSIYELDVNMPTNEMITLTVADWVVVENGKMKLERIYYDAREFAAAMQQA